MQSPAVEGVHDQTQRSKRAAFLGLLAHAPQALLGTLRDCAGLPNAVILDRCAQSTPG